MGARGRFNSDLMDKWADGLRERADNKIGDAGAEALVDALRHDRTVKTLDLHGTREQENTGWMTGRGRNGLTES